MKKILLEKMLQFTLMAAGHSQGSRYGKWKKKAEQDQKRAKEINSLQEENLVHNRLIAAASADKNQLLDLLNTKFEGLEEGEVKKSRELYGGNKVVYEKKKSVFQEIFAAFINPFSVILLFLAGISTITDIILPYYKHINDKVDPTTLIIILTMVMISGVLRFVQERRSGDAGSKLLDMITTTCSVKRHGKDFEEISIEEVVVGDKVHLAAGDMIPADLRIVEAKDLFVSQAALNGESEPQEKEEKLCLFFLRL